MIGTIVSHYCVIEELGRGGMGVVYKAEDTALDRTIALKFLPPAAVTDQLARERFVREAKAASGLDHRNVCTIHEIGETDDGQVFIAMACYDGSSLKSLLADGHLSVDASRDYAAQAADGLGVAHDSGIIHRDIKPGNLILTSRGVVKIVDFGLAKISGASITKGDARMGTIQYMSPEQARGELVDHRTDIWSLGVVLYEMITGEKPFQAPYDSAVFYSIINVDPKPPTAYRDDIPETIESIVLRCLEKDRELRYQSAEELASDLRAGEGSIKQESTSAQPATHRHLTLPRRAWTAAVTIFVAALLALSIGPVRNAVLSSDESTPNGLAVAVLPVLDDYSEPDSLLLIEGFSHYISKLLRDFETHHQSFWAAAYTDALFNNLATSEEVAGQLFVDRTVRPDVSLSGDAIDINIHLEDARTGERLDEVNVTSSWLEITQLQLDLVKVLVDLTELNLSDDQIRDIVARGTANKEAFRAMLLGMGYLRRPYDGPEYPERAYEAFKISAELDSSFAFVNVLLASASVTRFGFTRDPSWLQEALVHVDEAIRIDSTHAGSHVLRGIVLMQLGRQSDSEDAYKRALDLDPANRNAVHYYAQLLDRQNRPEETEDLFLSAIESNPYYWYYYSNLGAHYARELRYEDAIVQYRQVIDLAGDNAWGYVNLANQYLQLEDHARAESLYVTATTVNPDAQDAIAIANYKLGEIRYRQDDFTAAANFIETSIELSEENEEAWSLHGDASHWLRKTDAARESWRKAMELLEDQLYMNPETQDALELLAMTQAKLGLEEEALRTIDSLLTHERIPVGVYVSIGTAFEILDRRQDALEHIKYAVRNGYSREAIEASRWLDSLVEDRRYTCEFMGAPCET